MMLGVNESGLASWQGWVLGLDLLALDCPRIEWIEEYRGWKWWDWSSEKFVTDAGCSCDRKSQNVLPRHSTWRMEVL